MIVLDHTPFYAESGGQVGDTGELRNATSRAVVEDTTKIQADVFGHQVHVAEGTIAVGDTLNARVDGDKRARTMRNHSVTHLMHKALREVLGAHVQQKGSLVDADHTRFDFAHNAPVSDEQIRKVEALVNAEVLANTPTQARVMSMDDAQKLGAVMLFGEKYGADVRVLDIGSSRELCGGTHVQRTGDIGLFKIVSEGGVAAGVRRVEALTGDNALAYLQQLESTVSQVAGSLKVTPSELQGRVGAVLDQVRSLEKELAALKGRLASAQGDELLAQAVDVKGLKVLAATLAWRRCEDAARDDGQAEGQAQERCHRAGGGRRRQGSAGRRRHQRQHRARQGGRPRQLRGSAGRRQGRRQGRPRDGRRHRCRQAAAGAGVGARLGRRAAVRATVRAVKRPRVGPLREVVT